MDSSGEQGAALEANGAGKTAAGAGGPPAKRSLRRLTRRVVGIGLAGIVLAGASIAYRNSQMPKLAAQRRRLEVAEELARRQEAVQTRPGDADAHWGLASWYLQMGREADAEAETRAAIRIDPGHREAWNGLTRMLTFQHRFPEALRANREIIRRWPDSSVGYQGAALCYWQMEELDQALAVAKQALRTEDDPVGSRYTVGAVALDYAERGVIARLRVREYGLAVRMLEDVTRKMPGNADAFVRLGRAYQGIHQDEKALTSFRTAAKLNPGSADVLERLVQAAQNAGSQDEARETAERLAKGWPQDARGHFLLGDILLQSGKPDSLAPAAEQLAEAARLDPAQGPYQERLGVALVRQNRLQEARAAFEAANRLQPERPFPLQQLAALYSKLGDRQRATLAAKDAASLVFNEQQLKFLQQQSLHHPDALNLHLILGDRYRELGRRAAARDEYRTALRLDPGNASARSGLEALGSQVEAERRP